MQVITTNDYHVVDSAQNSTSQTRPRTPARTWVRIGLNQNSGSITNDRATPAAEVGNYQFASFTGIGGLQRSRIDRFGDAVGFNQMHATWVWDTFDSQGADLRHTCVIKH